MTYNSVTGGAFDELYDCTIFMYSNARYRILCIKEIKFISYHDFASSFTLVFLRITSREVESPYGTVLIQACPQSQKLLYFTL